MSRNRHGFLAAAIVLGCLSPRSDATAQDEKAAVPTLEEISSATASRNSNFKSLFVQYRMRGKLLGSAQDAKRYLDLLALIDETKAYAFSKNMRYMAIKRTSDHYEDIAPSVSVGKDGTAESQLPQPTQEFNEVLVKIEQDLVRKGRKPDLKPKAGVIPVEPEKRWRFDGELLSTWHGIEKPRLHLMGTPYTSANSDDRSCFDQTYMWVVFHSIPDAFHPERDRGEHRIPDAFSKFKARSRPAPEVMDGAACTVVELGDQYVLWCDPKLGYAVRRWDSLASGTDYVTDRFELRDFAEVTPQMWLPRKAVWTRWAPPDAPERVRREPLMQYLIDVESIHGNDVPDSLFKTDMKQVPKGTLIVDNINTIKDANGNELATNYKIPADVDKMNQAVEAARLWQIEEWKRRQTLHEAAPGLRLATPSRSSSRIWAVGANVAAVAALITFVWVRNRRRRAL